MELRTAFQSRRSYRLYDDRPVARETLVELIRAAQYAPVSCNLQLTQFVIIDDKELLQDLRKRVSYKFAYAPACMVVVFDPRFTVEHNSAVMTAGMQVENMLLRATELGLATLPMAGFKKDDVIKKTLGIPEHLELLLLIAVGYPKGGVPRAVTKLPTEDLFRFNHYGDMLTLNGSSRLAEHTTADLVEYRSRIAPVYLERFRLHTYDETYYEKTLELFLAAVPNAKSVLDLLSYDGLFAKLLTETQRDIQISVSDHSEYVRNFLNTTLKLADVPVSLENGIETESHFDAVTLVFKANFTPDLAALVTSALEHMTHGGVLFIATIDETWYRRAAKSVRRLKRALFGMPDNIYEGNAFYKIGPYRFVSSQELVVLTQSQCDLISRDSTQVGNGVVLRTVLLRKR